MGIFSPKDKSYLELYKKQANYVLECSKFLNEVVAAGAESYPDIQKRMFALEDEADNVKHDISRWIRSTFVTPFDRDDMYRLATNLDDVVDAFYEVVDLICLFHIDELPKKATKQVGILADLAVQNFAVISGLSDINVHVNELMKMRELVIDCEKSYRALLSKTMENKKISAVELIKTKSLADSLNNAANSFKSVAYAVETMGIKEA